MDKLLTIVIPTYNMQDYLRKCLDSLIVDESKMPLLEVLVINDGSKDSSSEIAHEYESRFPGIFRVIDKENGGHGSCCNVGLAEATGKYFRILDADDWLTSLDVFLVCLSMLDVDIVFTKLNQYFEDTDSEQIVERLHPDSKVCLVKDLTVSDFQGDYKLTNHWYATYRTSMMKPYQPLFAPYKYYTDTILHVAPLVLGRTFVSLDMVLYNYRLGRIGQSVAPDVMAKNRNLMVRTGSHAHKFISDHRLMSDCSSEVLDFIIARRIGIWISYLPSFLSYSVCREQMKDVSKVVPLYCPEKAKSMSLRLYRILPFWIYYFGKRFFTNTKSA